MGDMDKYERFRVRVLKSLCDELLGPGPDDDEARQREVLDVSPLQLYSTGVLFPQNSLAEQREDDGTQDVSGDPGADSAEAEEPKIEVDTSERETPEATELNEEPLNLANEFNPSAAGITVRVTAGIKLVIEIYAGQYESDKAEVAHPRAGQTRADGSVYPETRTVVRYERVPIRDTVTLDSGIEAAQPEPVPIAGTNEALKLHVRVRHAAAGQMTVSLALVNHRKASGLAAPPFNAAFFQPRITVREAERGPHFFPSS